MDWGTLEESEKTDWVEAAVLIPCVRRAGEDFLILTKRTEEVLHHKGQICFPGGTRDPGDASLWETALREAHEEIGLDPASVTAVRELGKHFTPTGFRVTPFVGRVEPPVVWRPNPLEIAEIISIPLSHLSDPVNLRLLKSTYGGKEFLDPRFAYGNHVIWGMTGRVLFEFLELASRTIL